MSRIQIDLIDMRDQPDGEFKWIAHVMDHWSKFHVMWPLTRKTAQQVADGLQEKVFAVFGTPIAWVHFHNIHCNAHNPATPSLPATVIRIMGLPL